VISAISTAIRRSWTVAIVGVIVACNGEFHFDEGSDASITSSCTKDTDCKLGTLYCDVSSGLCVECNGLDDAQCTQLGRPRCDTALHACVECGVNQDCGSNGACVTSTRKCVPKCVESINCPVSTPRCDENIQRCFECTKSEDCKSGTRRLCEIPTGRCVECLQESDCSSGHCATAISKCVDCRSSADCSNPTPLCDPTSNTCVAGS